MLLFVIPPDLCKARPKGSRNKTVKYIARYQLPSGEWKRIYADDTQTNEAGELTVPLSQVVNEHFFGTIGEDKKGNPVVTPGVFVTHKPVYATEQVEIEGARKTKVTGVQFKKEQRISGYMSLEWAPGILRQYTPSKAVKELQLTPEKQAEHAQMYGLKRTEAGWEKEEREKLTPVSGGGGDLTTPTDLNAAKKPSSIHVVPELSESSKKFLGEPLTQTVDPIAVAAGMVAAGKHKIARVPEQILDKWRSLNKPAEQAFRDDLSDRPITTLITLGKWNQSNPTAQKELYKEWNGIIYQVARGIANQHWKQTTAFQNVAGQYGTDEGGKRVSLEDTFIKDKISQLMSEGQLLLWQAATGYKANGDPDSRFDKKAYSQIYNGLLSHSSSMGRKEGEELPTYGETWDEYETSMSPRDLSPDEAYEYARFAKPAKAILEREIKYLPEAYQRVLTSRLWLDEGGEETEHEKIKREAAQLGVGGVVAKKEAERESRKQLLDVAKKDALATATRIKTIEFRKKIGKTNGEPLTADEQAKLRTRITHEAEMRIDEVYEAFKQKYDTEDATAWQRHWTGKQGVAKQYDVWRDPETNEKVKMTSTTHQRRKLDQWYGEALQSVISGLSHHGILTNEGRTVKRWLELEAKLATNHRRRFNDVERRDIEGATTTTATAPVTSDAPKFDPDRAASVTQDISTRLSGIKAQLKDYKMTVAKLDQKLPPLATKTAQTGPQTPKKLPKGVSTHATGVQYKNEGVLPFAADNRALAGTGLSRAAVHHLWASFVEGKDPSVEAFADRVIKPLWNKGEGGKYSTNKGSEVMYKILNALQTHGVVHSFARPVEKSFVVDVNDTTSLMAAFYRYDLALSLYREVP